MDFATIPVFSAVWLGILTSISPCPLASNIAAVSYILKGIEKTSSVLIAGIAYTLGRVIAYSVLGVLISTSLLNVPKVAQYLQFAMPKILGPVLVITGFFLLEIVSFSFTGTTLSEKAINRFKNSGIYGALPLGVLFALAFCPVSAALFFGSLIPLSFVNSSPVLLPAVYGIGTGLPVFFFAIIISFGVKNLSCLFAGVKKIDLWSRRITGWIFIIIGIYYILTRIFYIEIF